MQSKDWFEWHEPYGDPTSDLGNRLAAVQRGTRGALDRAAPGPIRIVSICAGQGRDLLGALNGHPRRGDAVARLVELDPRNAQQAAAAAIAAGLRQVKVVEGDASVTAAYDGAVPADIVLICGVFGHATDDDIEATIRHLPSLCARSANVIWTRGGFPPDLRPTIRAWFLDNGFAEVSFDSGGREGWGVGVNRLVAQPSTYVPDVRLFTFLDELAVGD